jgi:cellulose synthase/poly-beta-1,6-N-acetylglucosamine synthase-like glycosyltransferase
VISLIRPCRDTDKPIPARCYADEEIVDRTIGLSASRNAGAARSKGDVLLFLDADTYLEGDTRWFEGRSEDYWVPSFRCTDWGLWTRGGNAFFNTMNKLPPFNRFSWGHGAATCVKRKAFEAIGGFDVTAPVEDVNILVRLWKAGYAFCIAPVTAVSIRHITFPPSRRNMIIDGQSGRRAGPMPKLP